MAKIKLKEWADKNGLSYITANRHFHAGLIPNAQQLDSGTILVEDDTPEPAMLGNTTNDAMSLFLKKTVEFSKNNATVEDFAAYVISNFVLKMNNGPESPRYSRQKPKSEDVQRHFQQFMPKGEKPKPNSFVLEPDSLEQLREVSKPTDPRELVQEFKQAIENRPTTGTHVTGVPAATSPEGTVTRNVDLSTPQQINYTGSQNPTFNGSLTTTSSTYLNNGVTQVDTYCIPLNTSGGIVVDDFGCTMPIITAGTNYNSLCFSGSGHLEDSKLVGAFQPTQKELESSKEQQTFAPKRRGRKPTAKR